MTVKEKDHDRTNMVHFVPKISASTDSDGSMAQATRWIKECSESHEECKAAFPKTIFVPKRLVEISGAAEDQLRICLRERKTLPSEVCYATLSHCWGSTMPFMLKRESLSTCLKSISLSDISKVFKDAITFAWRMNIRYIWIDSLCKI